MSTATLTSTLQNAESLRTIAFPGRNVSVPTRHRWALTGCLDASGKRVKLRTWKVGGRLVTTPEAVESFILALSGDVPASEADAAVSRGKAAGSALEAMGC